jgi:hypothetical protein
MVLSKLSNDALFGKFVEKVRYDHYGWGEPEKDDWPTQGQFEAEIKSRMSVQTVVNPND